MATTKKDGAPAREILGPSPTTPATLQNRRPRPAIVGPSSPASSPSEKTAAPPAAAAKKPTPNYLKPTFSSSTEAARHAIVGTTKLAASPRSPSTKKVPDSKAVQLPRRSSSSSARMQAKPVLTSRPSFSERTLKGKSTPLPQRADSLPRRTPVVRTKGKCSSVASSVASGASSPKAMTEETMSNEDREAALDILDLDLEEHILLQIPALEDRMAQLAEEPGPGESDVAEEFPAFEEERVPVVPDPVVPEAKTSNDEEQHGEVDGAGQVTEMEEIVAADEEGNEQELPTFETAAEEEEKAANPDETEEEEKTLTAAASCGHDVKEDAAEEVESEERGEEGGEGSEEKIEATNEEAAAAAAASPAAEPEKEKKKSEATREQQQQGKRGPAPAYNDVIEETASRLVEKRKGKVQALVGAFETVIVLDSGGQAQ